MGVIRSSLLLVLALALAGPALYARPAQLAAGTSQIAVSPGAVGQTQPVAVGGARGPGSAGSRAVVPGGAQLGVRLQTPAHSVAALPMASVAPGVVPVPVGQPVLPPAPPFGSTTLFVGNGFVSFPVVPVTASGITMPLSAIGFAAGADLVPPVVIGGGFLTNTFLFQTPFGPAIAQPQQAPFVTVGSNIVNVGAQPSFCGPFFPVPAPFGFPGAPNPFLPGFAPFVVQ